MENGLDFAWAVLSVYGFPNVFQLQEEEEDDLVSRAICAAVCDCDFSVPFLP